MENLEKRQNILTEKQFQLKNHNIINVLFFLIWGSIYSQYSDEYNMYIDKYPDSNIVRLNQEIIITIKLIDGELDIKQEIIKENLYLDERAIYGSKSSLNSSYFFELEDVEAYSLSFEKGKYRELKVENFTEKNDLDQSFYDDTKILNFIYPNLRKGSKSKLYYSHKVKNPRFIRSFYFGDYYPIVNNKATIIVDKGIVIEFKEFNTKNNKIEFTKEIKRKHIIYRWELNDIDEYKYEENSPNYRKILPHIVPIITSYKVKGKTEKLLGEISDLYRWYYSLIKDINTDKPSKEMLNLVNEIIFNKKSDIEKVKAIYYWVQKNIKYIAFEYALGGFKPRESNDVFRKKYGDCKDNSSVLFKMLEIAGLEGHLTWIGTRSIPYTYSEVPTPIVDNHMILSYENNGKTYFLDATGRYMKLGMPTSFIQGKDALISDGDNFEIKKVPVVSAKNNAVVDSTYISIEGSSIVGKSRTIISGYPKINYFRSLENKNSQSKLKEYYNDKFKKGNNKFLIKEFKELNKYSYDDNFIVNYTFEIDNHIKKMGDEIFINLNFNKELSKSKIDKERENSIEFRYKKYYSFYTVLDIPANYEVDYLPENISLSTDLLNCDIT
ncbi:MAG: DUF3857 domain-containing protein, partial [Flavobacteriaceae bacterium]|nr:DUF3857 domain-containing protein [Flavobacteriaceae bacterium]